MTKIDPSPTIPATQAMPDAEATPDADWLAAPSPCVGVCRYDAPKGRCVACAMARHDKQAFKRIDGADAAGRRRAFFVRTVRRLARQGGLMAWLAAYRAKCSEQDRRDATRGL